MSHFKFSPSGASRWLACPDSLHFTQEDDTGNTYTREGTCAHAVAESCLLLGCPADVYLGQKRTVEGETFEVTPEMVEAVNCYLETVERLRGKFDYFTEVKFQHSTLPDFGGTADCVIPAASSLIDLKYGSGYAVEVEENPQLSCYALLLQDRYNVNGDVELTIVQPRAPHPDGPVRTWIATGEYLAYFRERVEAVILGKRHGLHAGDHCRWCPGKVECPELYELTIKAAKAEFSPEGMTAIKAAQVMGQRKAVAAYLDAVASWSHGQLEKGQAIPGYKLVDTFANRKYRFDAAKIARICAKAGFGKKKIYTSEILSPAQLEKVVGKDLITQLVERPHTGTTVVPESDRRPAAKGRTASEEFANLEIGESYL